MFATINGVRTYYETMGSGPPLVAVHGGPGIADHGEYSPWLDPLSDSFEIVTYDLRGCGRSDDPPSGTYSHEDFVADLDALRAYLDFGQFALLGTSYGGMIGLEYALRHGDRLTHLILQDTSASMEHDEEALQTALESDLGDVEPDVIRRMFGGQMRSDAEFREAFAAILPLYRATPDPDADAQDLARLTFRHRAHNYAFSQNAPKYDLRSRLGEIRVPTLVIGGRKDWITPPADSEEIAARVPNARLVFFENSGHQPMIEEQDGFIGLVREFLATPGGAS